MVSCKGAISIQWEKTVFQHMVLGQLGIHIQKNQVRYFVHTIYILRHVLKCKSKSCKTKGNIGLNLCDWTWQ